MTSTDTRVVVRTMLTSHAPSPHNRRLAKDLAWAWVGQRWPRLLPARAQLEDSEIQRALPGSRLHVSSSEDGRTWRLEVTNTERDGNFGWTTRAVVADLGDADGFAVETRCDEPRGNRPVAPPKLLGSWVERLELQDGGIPVQGEPRIVDVADCDALCEQLLRPERKLAILVLSNKPRSQYWGVDPRALAEAVRGLAHVVCLPPDAAAELASRFGRRLAPAAGAVRVYRPGFTAEAASHEHPVIRPVQREGEEAPASSPGSFRRYVCQRVCEMSVA